FPSEEDVFASAESGFSPVLWISAGRRLWRHDLASGQRDLIAQDLPDIVTSLAEDKSGQLWCGTTSAGVLTVSIRARAGRAQAPDARYGLPFGMGSAAVGQTDQGTVLIL